MNDNRVKTPIWMVRAGGGSLFEGFQRDGVVAIGFGDIGDLTNCTSLDQIRERYLLAHPDAQPMKAANAVAIVYKFRSILKPGDKVVTYNPESREYLVGSVAGNYRYEPEREGGCKQVRAVDWHGRVARDVLKPASRNSLGSVLTLFQLNEETAADLLSALSGDAPPPPEEEKRELEQLKEDTISRAHELIKDRILRLADDQMEELVSAVLRAMGYKSRVTPQGPDRGVDVIASPDGLGLEEPRIKAEVKHRPNTRMGSQQLRSFLGGLREGDRGLFVSTGGFSKDAGYEADRSNIPITLLNLDELATLVVSHYENFDAEGRLLIPLTRLYWPVE